MSNSGVTTRPDQVTSGQSGKEVTLNAALDALSPSLLFGRRATSTSGLTWGYYGGVMRVDGVLTSIAEGTVSLTPSTTNYVEVNRSGTVSVNTTGFTAGRMPLYTIGTGSSTITSHTDNRPTLLEFRGRLSSAIFASDANVTLTAAQAANRILDCTSSVSLTATRNVVLPLSAQEWIVYNGTTGAQSIQFIGASGTGITVANGKRAIIYADGTNIVRVTADT